jgi:hypothetical protein
VATFGKIKLTAVQKLTRKEDSEARREGASKGRERKSNSKVDRGMLQLDSRMSPGKDREKGGILVDPRRRVNVPLIKEHLRMLITAFCKRFDPS